ncbi:MAG: hypothetical protein EBT50_08345 [Verrucomicrobia bacterium]|nr:hypothetical protein [Verrucomicrobiota bacterium]
MMKKEEKMIKAKKQGTKVLGPEGIEDGLMGMGRAIEAGGPWTHPEMDRIPEWRGQLRRR